MLALQAFPLISQKLYTGIPEPKLFVLLSVEGRNFEALTFEENVPTVFHISIFTQNIAIFESATKF